MGSRSTVTTELPIKHMKVIVFNNNRKYKDYVYGRC